MKKTSRLVNALFSAAEDVFSPKKKQENRQLFSQLSSTILPQAMRIKQSYGFFEREFYVIKSHRKKESVKVIDTCSLADMILDKIKDHEESVSPQLLDEYYTIRMLEMELEELVEKTVEELGSYYLDYAEYELKKKKLILVKSYMIFLKRIASRAGVLHTSLEDTADFYQPFIDHLLENVLIIEEENNRHKMKLTGIQS